MPSDTGLRKVESTFSAGLTTEGGFLPKEVPPVLLPDPFDQFVTAAAELPRRYHGSTQGVRRWLDALFAKAPDALDPELDALSEAQRDRLFSAISVLSHAYRWDTAPPRKEEYERLKIVLPAGLAAPWASLACRLQIPRVGNLYSMVLCNFSLKHRTTGGVYRNEEIVASNTEIAHPWLVEPEASGLRSFLLAPIETEARGALAVRTSVELLRAVVSNDPHHVIYLLDRLRAEIQAMGLPFREFIQKKLIKPDHFLTLIQPTTIWGLDEGDGHGPLEGASGPQVGCIQTIDALLGVKRESPMAKAILRSRDYMPLRHRRFVDAMEAASRWLPDFVEAQKNRQMSDLFNECLEGMEAWRRVHQVRGAIYLKGETTDPNRAYMSTGGVVALEDERIARFKASMEERASETLAAVVPEVPLAAETGLTISFQYLSAADREALMSVAQRVEFAANAVIVAEGVRRAGLYLVQSGTVRVVRRGAERNIVLARLSAGDLFGEMSFLENETTSASIEAEDCCVLDIIPREQVFTFCHEREGFAARFYQSLATLLSRRLATTSDLARELLTQETPRAYRGRTPRVATGSVPQSVIDFTRTIRSEIESGENEATITSALNKVLGFTESGTSEFGPAWPDAADHLFREMFPILMRSPLARTLYGRPGGHAFGVEAVDLLCEARDGGVVDRWLRAIPTLHGMANVYQELATVIANEPADCGKAPVSLLALGAAPVKFLCEAVSKHPTATAMALEWDAESATASGTQFAAAQL